MKPQQDDHYDSNKRPPNAYMLFCMDTREKILRSEPDLTYKSVMNRLGELWKSMPEEDRKQYRVKAKKLQAEFKLKNPTSKYEPRIPKTSHQPTRHITLPEGVSNAEASYLVLLGAQTMLNQKGNQQPGQQKQPSQPTQVSQLYQAAYENSDNEETVKSQKELHEKSSYNKETAKSQRELHEKSSEIEEFVKLQRELRQKISEIESLRSQLTKQIEINSELSHQIKERDSIIHKISPSQSSSASMNSSKENDHLKSFTGEVIESLEKVCDLHHDDTVNTYEVIKRDFLILKEVNKVSNKKASEFIEKNELINKIKHPNIAEIKEIHFDEKTSTLSILYERSLINLKEVVVNKNISKVESSFIIYEIAEGMKFVHSNKIIHSSLKPSNILIGKDGNVKISDIGMNALKTSEKEPISLCDDISGLYFISPEVLNNEPRNEKIDVYAFGVIVYFIISGGELPSKTLSEMILKKPPQVPSSFSPNAKEIIDYCCCIDPQIRPSFTEIVDYLKNEQCILMDLSKSELAEVQNRIKEHQKIIPHY